MVEDNFRVESLIYQFFCYEGPGAKCRKKTILHTTSGIQNRLYNLGLRGLKKKLKHRRSKRPTSKELVIVISLIKENDKGGPYYQRTIY